MTMRTFRGFRPAPPTDYAEKGITNSGSGPDYEGVVFSDGTVALRWQTEFRSTALWPDYATFYQVHGHPEYGTVIEFDDGQPEPPILTAPGLRLVISEAGPHGIHVYNELDEC